MIDIRDLELLLETYTLEEILEENDLSTADCLHYLVTSEFVTLPTVRPV